MNNDTQKQIDQLKRDIEFLKQKRVSQTDLLPQVVKNRNMGESNPFVTNILSTDLPTVGYSVTIGTQMYYLTDTKKLVIWNPTTNDWDEVQFT